MGCSANLVGTWFDDNDRPTLFDALNIKQIKFHDYVRSSFHALNECLELKNDHGISLVNGSIPDILELYIADFQSSELTAAITRFRNGIEDNYNNEDLISAKIVFI